MKIFLELRATKYPSFEYICKNFFFEVMCTTRAHLALTKKNSRLPPKPNSKTIKLQPFQKFQNACKWNDV